MTPATNVTQNDASPALSAPNAFAPAPETATINTDLNAADPAVRLENLRRLRSSFPDPVPGDEVNNHIHTMYSFSSYSPSLAAWRAWQAGLKVVGIVDHDSVAGADEMRRACTVLGLQCTVGCEFRARARGTALEGRLLNMPNVPDAIYLVLHGIPAHRLSEVQDFLGPIRQRREERNRAQLRGLNRILATWDIPALDYDRQVLAISCFAEGGSITERHILAALAARLLDDVNDATDVKALITRLEEQMRLSISPRQRTQLMDFHPDYIRYDLLEVLKQGLLSRFFIMPDETECPLVRQIVEFANSIGAIPAYAYLGQARRSSFLAAAPPRYEDAYLRQLVPELKRIGFPALTYMPPRNTRRQLLRLRRLCHQHGMMEISGVDINSPRQSFNCPIVLQFPNLIEATWAMVVHEQVSLVDERWGLFHHQNPLVHLPLADRLAVYADIGRHQPKNEQWEPTALCALLEARV